MKVRNGFVSNSSSSSFIIWAKKLPQTVEEVKDLFWPDTEVIRTYNGCISVFNICKYIVDTFNNSNKNLDELVQLISRDFYVYPDIGEHMPIEVRRKKWTKAIEDANLIGIAKTCDIIESQPIAMKFFIVEIEDHDEIGAYLEHGSDISRVFPDTIKISHH